MHLLIRMEEIWKSIEGYETYSVSTFGNVRNDKTGKILKAKPNGDGRLIVSLHKKNYQIHRLVAIAFIENSENKECVDHIDNNSTNNNLTNLRWATHQENQHNKQIQINNTSGIKGVVWHKKDKKWQSQIYINRKCIYIGSYNTIEEATIARQFKANELFGEFTHSCEKH